MNFELWPPLRAPEPLSELLNRFLGWGSVIEHHLFAVEGEVDRAAHFQAAISGLEGYRHYGLGFYQERVKPLK